MARKQARDISKNKIISAQRVFTDREKPQMSFKKRLSIVNQREYSILHFYGVGGIGKTTLQKHLQKELDKDEETIYSWLDFEKSENQHEHYAYRVIVDRFKEQFNISFTSFNIAYIIYLKKSNPNMEISKESLPFVDEGEILASALDMLDNIGGLASLSIDLIKYVGEKVKENHFNFNIKNELNKLKQLETDKIEEKLIDFLAYDIKVFKEKNPNIKVVIFLDTHEALWRNDRKEANILTKDIWIRDNLVTQLKNVLFVISGREKLKWEEDDSSWIEKDDNGFSDLEQHSIGNLSQNDARYFLNSCDIKDILIQDTIIKNSNGVPYYLDLCVETYIQMKEKNIEPNVKDFQNIGKHEIFERFMRYLDKEEVATLKVLATTNFYNKELFQATIENFKTGYPSRELNIFNNFSFIKNDNGKFYIHDLMKKSLLTSIDMELKQETDAFYFNYYYRKLEDLDIKNITEEQEEAFKEAFYHSLNIADIKTFSKWFTETSEVFKKASKYKILLELTSKFKNINKDLQGEIDLYTANSYNLLAAVYVLFGKKEEALSLYFEAIEIINEFINFGSELDFETNILYYETEFIFDPIDFATNIYIDLASLLINLERFDEALILYDNVLTTISFYESCNTETFNISKMYIDLTNLYIKDKDFEKAYSHASESVRIRTILFGENHYLTADSYLNLSNVFILSSKYEEALSLLNKTLKIYKDSINEEDKRFNDIYFAFASIFFNLGRFNEAIVLYQKTLLSYLKSFNDSHPKLILICECLKDANLKIGETREALRYCRKSLSLNIKLYGEESLNVAQAYESLAVIYKNLEDYETSKIIYEKTDRIKEKINKEEHQKDELSSVYKVQKLEVNCLVDIDELYDG